MAWTGSFLWMIVDSKLISQALYLAIAAGILFFVIGILGLFGAITMDKTILLVVSKEWITPHYRENLRSKAIFLSR